MQSLRNDTNIKSRVLPILTRITGELRCFLYRGRSMRGTFRTGDCLTVEPVSFDNIYKGDVVVFCGLNESGETKELVHRVMTVSPESLITRGDNNPYIDITVVTPDILVGRVTHVERDGKKRRIHGGYLGLMRARILHAWLHVRRLIGIVLGIPYRWLRKSDLVSMLWRPVIKKIHFKTDNGPLIKYIYGKRTVARWWPEEGRFECRKPYDLVLHCPDSKYQIPNSTSC